LPESLYFIHHQFVKAAIRDGRRVINKFWLIVIKILLKCRFVKLKYGFSLNELTVIVQIFGYCPICCDAIIPSVAHRG